jgi:hypothetical protein
VKFEVLTVMNMENASSEMRSCAVWERSVNISEEAAACIFVYS